MVRILFQFSFFALIASAAHAYIDPGSGSALMTVVIGIFVAIGVTIKSFWYKIKSAIGLSKKAKDNDE